VALSNAYNYYQPGTCHVHSTAVPFWRELPCKGRFCVCRGGLSPVHRRRANVARMSQSRPDSGLGLGHFRYESRWNYSSCFRLARQQDMIISTAQVPPSASERRWASLNDFKDFHCYLSQQSFHFCFATFHSRLLSRSAALFEKGIPMNAKAIIRPALT